MNIAIVGCGSIAKVHADCVELSANHRLVAFADSIKERAEQFAIRYGGTAYESFEEMMDKETIDVLHVCTPQDLHVPMTVYALEHGLHVFMQQLLM